MARGKSVTAEALIALGAEPLAALLIDHATADAGLRKKLAILLAAAKGGHTLADEIDKRLRSIARSRTTLEGENYKALHQELDHIRVTIVTQLAATTLPRAIEQLWTLVGMADNVIERVPYATDRLENVFDAAMADLGRLIARDPPADRAALARRVLACSDDDSNALIRHLSEALGPAGRAVIRRATQNALRAKARTSGARDVHAEYDRYVSASRLAILADLDRDVDAYIAAMRAVGQDAAHGLEIAQRLHAAGRPAEALAWLETRKPRDEDEAYDNAAIDLRIAALEALGRMDEAQAARWQHFETWLSAAHLRAYLTRLPDFEDADAEQRALDIAGTHAHAARSLVFLVEWRANDRAARLVRDRLSSLDARFYDALKPAAEALEQSHPEEATLLYRRLIESTLERGSSKDYAHASRDLATCARLASHLPQPVLIERHWDFVARLRRSYGRKYSFWKQTGAAGR